MKNNKKFESFLPRRYEYVQGLKLAKNYFSDDIIIQKKATGDIKCSKTHTHT